MTEKSLFWYTNGFTGDTGDGAAPYTQEEFRLHNHAQFANNRANVGVFPGVANELEVTGTSSPLSANTGRASVYGFSYWADAAVSLAVTTPGVGTTGGRVVLRADWTAQTVRATVVMSADGTATIPSMTQTAGVTWDIPLATFTITTGGTITVSDVREWVQPVVYRRQGADVDNWGADGTTNYIPGNSVVQVGRVQWTGSAAASSSVAVTLPASFAATGGAIAFAQSEVSDQDVRARAILTAADTLTIFWTTNDASTRTSIEFSWVAIGAL